MCVLNGMVLTHSHHVVPESLLHVLHMPGTRNTMIKITQISYSLVEEVTERLKMFSFLFGKVVAGVLRDCGTSNLKPFNRSFF